MLFIMGFADLVIALCALLPFGWSDALAQQMVHPEWNGFSHHDTIFPLFLFLAGVSFPFSLKNSRSKGLSNNSIYYKIVKRAVVLFLLGLVYNGALNLDFESMRIPSVLGRIGVAWAVAALITMRTSWVTRIYICASVLICYTLIIGENPTIDNNYAGRIDQALLSGHLYLENFDPEGIFSTIPAVVTALLGVFAGEIILSAKRTPVKRAAILAVIGGGFCIAGFIWSYFAPVNKSLWTAPFVCYTACYSFIMLALFYYIIDVRGRKNWTLFFRVIGLNSITIYLGQRFISFPYTNDFTFGGVWGLFPDGIASVLWWCSYIALCWGVLYFCYKKNIFLKV